MWDWLLYSLVVWRVSSLLTHERGPFDVFGKLRDRLGIYYDEASQCQGRNEVARALCCLWCTSVWVALIAALLFFREQWIVYTLALSAGAIGIERIVHG